MFRAAAITGRPEAVRGWCLDRQGGRWAQQTVAAAMPRRSVPPARDPEQLHRDLDDLQRRGILTQAERERLHASLT